MPLYQCRTAELGSGELMNILQNDINSWSLCNLPIWKYSNRSNDSQWKSKTNNIRLLSL